MGGVASATPFKKLCMARMDRALSLRPPFMSFFPKTNARFWLLPIAASERHSLLGILRIPIGIFFTATLFSRAMNSEDIADEGLTINDLTHCVYKLWEEIGLFEKPSASKAQKSREAVRYPFCARR